MRYPDVLRGRRVLVTGGTGFLGSHVAEIGERLGVELHLLCRREPAAKIPGTVWLGDLSDGARMQEVVTTLRPQGILHLAAEGVSYGTGSVARLARVNTLGVVELLEAAAALPDPPAVVIAGSGFEYAPQSRPLRESDPMLPNSAYGATKAAGSLLAGIFARQMPVTVLRLFSLYGPGEQEPRLAPYIVAQARQRKPVEITAGEQLRDYALVTDVAQGFWRVLAAPPQDQELRVLNLATGQGVTLRCFIEALAGQLRLRGIASDLHFGARQYRHDEMMQYTADVGLLERTLGWLPSTPLERGLALTLEKML